ncbi:MAG TPA: tetratricopeptide repeat protein [Anaerolineales bacterium]
MNRRRQHFNWFRIVLLTLLIAGGLYVDKFIIPSVPAVGVPSPTATRPPESYVTEAQGLFQQGKLNPAIQAYEQAIVAKPNDPTIYVALAEVQVFAGDYKGAQASAENALLLDPNNTMAHSMRAWALDYQGDTLAAENSIKQALQLDDHNAVAHAFYAEILVDQGAETIPKAIEESKVAMALAPDTLITHRARGYVLEATGNYEDAVREYQAAIQINPNIPDLHIKLGINYSTLGIYDQAVQEFGRANALNPADPLPPFYTSRTYSTVGEFAKARQYAQTAVHDDPSNARYHGNLGVMDYHNALFTEAAKELGLAINGGAASDGTKVQGLELVPGSPLLSEMYFTYALALAQLGQCGGTLQIAQEVQTRIPTDEAAVTSVNKAIAMCQQNVNAGPGTALPSSGAAASGTATPTPTLLLSTLPPVETATP